MESYPSPRDSYINKAKYSIEIPKQSEPKLIADLQKQKIRSEFQRILKYTIHHFLHGMYLSSSE